MKRTKRESDTDFDVDHDVLDRILNKLYDFGDGSDDERSKKKHRKRKRFTEEQEEDLTAAEESLTKVGCETEDANVSHVTDAVDAGDKCNAKAPDVEIVTFQDPRRKKEKPKRVTEAEAQPAESTKKKKKDPDVLSIEKARLDVHRFGITGFQKQQQRVFEQDRAIMLGARPPRKDYVNYKVFQQMMKEKRAKEMQEVKAEAPMKKQKKPSGKQKIARRQPGAEPAGHVGRFKNGMLVLSSKDILKLPGKVRK